MYLNPSLYFKNHNANSKKHLHPANEKATEMVSVA